MLREEKMVLKDVRRLGFVFVGFGVGWLLGRISRNGVKPMRGIMEAIWNTRA